ncbi:MULTISPECIES: ABC transporter permease [Olsenella]|uniref:ABC transporter permease n=1 Tax=Olsenella TaxID=133925 RepID=UPI0007858501|nr:MULTISPECIES: ABC transporter permease [Olsenella]KXB61511.1 putative autoinducer 2 ABC transporter, permease protein LsrC [Olsenella sp. DNF00959]
MGRIKNLLHARSMSSFAFLVILFLVVGLINPAFLTPSNISACFNTSVVYTLVAVGMAFTLFIGEIDVSVGANLGLVAAVVGSMLRDGQSMGLAIIVGVVIGAMIGLINAWGVAVMKAPSLIFTLGVNGVLRGIVYVYTNGAWVENLPKGFKDFSSVTAVGDLTVYYCATIVLVAVIQLLLVRTKRGRYFHAVGDNAQGATLVGLPTRTTKILAYVICGVMAAIGGIIFCSRIGFVTPASGNGYEMKAIAACVLGGISLLGGVGSVVGSAIGAVIMASISYLLVFMGFSSNYDNAITGIILIVIVVVDALLQRRAIVKNRHARLAARVSSGTEVAAAAMEKAQEGGEA